MSPGLPKTWIGCAARNFHVGRNGVKPEAIVVHVIVGSLKSAGFTFLDPKLDLPRSAHYGVGKAGEIHQYVAEEDTAYHAGTVVGARAKLVIDRAPMNPNRYTIGIEHEGIPDTPWPEKQIDASARLIAEVAGRWGMSIDATHIIPHRDIRSTKTCPGFGVDVNALIQRAAALREAAASAPERVTEGFPRTVVITRPVRLRGGAPSTSAPILSALSPGTSLTVSARVRGDAVIGGTQWWCEVGGGSSYFWAGASDLVITN
jgi:hypothetical protein